MVEHKSPTKPFNWRLILFAVVSPLLISSIQIVFWDNFFALLGFLLATGVVSLIVLILAILKVRRQTLSVLSMLLVYCCLSWSFYVKSYDIRTAGRWLFESKQYKAEINSSQELPPGDLKHVEWDAWGFAGADTTVYLVYDPDDALSTASRSHSSGKFPGLPCKVVRVRRLEDRWYTALFYTDTDWDHCS